VKLGWVAAGGLVFLKGPEVAGGLAEGCLNLEVKWYQHLPLPKCCLWRLLPPQDGLRSWAPPPWLPPPHGPLLRPRSFFLADCTVAAAAIEAPPLAAHMESSPNTPGWRAWWSSHLSW